MSKSFSLTVLTPEREFYKGPAESLIIESIDGELCILADHIPMVAALGVGELKIKTEEKVLSAFHSEGFLEVHGDSTTVLLQACEWPEEIDINRAKEALERAEARLEQQRNVQTLARSKIAMSRALMRIKVKSTSDK
ncbi:MAG: ATP synthase F1 subunit epsilon [Clostridiaceae bacterium]|nr:ATP synthase F1 subunit epsilon [Clostridiaceae bacterium]